jgi:hypothetical protein
LNLDTVPIRQGQAVLEKTFPWCTLPGLLANFWQNGFRIEIPERESEKSRVFAVILWWALVDDLRTASWKSNSFPLFL